MRHLVSNRSRRAPLSWTALFGAGVGLIGFLLLASPLAASVPAATLGTGGTVPSAPALGAAVGPSAVSAASATPAASTPAAGGAFNPPCYKIDTNVCVSMLNPNETDIIPPSGSFVSTQEPNATSDLILVVKSHNPLDWPAAPKSGALSPIALNVTGRLWNGDPYYSVNDGTIWHSNQPTNWWTKMQEQTTNLTYPWWYTVTFSAHQSNGAPNFFPGMTVNWWLYLTYNVSSGSTSQFVHHSSPVFQFTYSGAWPFSPYPGSGQYVGASATFEDINLTVTPRAPNFNDSVTFVVNTTQADVLSNATIGPNSYLDVSEVSTNGSVVAAGTFPFPVNVQGGFGSVSTTVVVPAAYALDPGATVTYVLSVRDMANDLLVTPAASYTVGGNGSFLSGIFPDDLELITHPESLLAEPVGTVQLAPGTPVNLTLLSRNPGTAISAAEVVYTLSYPLLRETTTLTVPFQRITSTHFVGAIPGLPIGSFVNFTVYAWDHTERLEISPELGYFTPDLATQIPVIPGNASFFYVFVYDNGTGHWVTGADVQIQGFGGVYSLSTNTTAGIAYPNQSFAPYVPLLLAANASYRITVHDPYFIPAAGAKAPSVNVSLLAVHDMVARQTLAAGSNYWVVQEGNAVLFWLNATPPPPAPSPSNGGGSVPLPAIVGVVGATVVMIPLVRWFSQIRARRKAEERRVTL